MPQIPLPSSEAVAHSQDLIDYITNSINQKQGKINFAEFMHHALYAPNLGYYSAGCAKFGAEGDFVTAPELSPIFGLTIAQQVAAIIQSQPSAKILEFGAGSGALAIALLKGLAALNCLPEEYWILEVSADLRQRQQQNIMEQLPDYAKHVHWLSSLPDTPFSGVILANEVLDAMPVKRFKYQNDTVEELYVTYEDKHFHEVYLPSTDDDLNQLVTSLTLPQPYFSEFNPALGAWLNSLYSILTQGVVLLIDYGFPRHEFYHPQRNTGTLMCHYRHYAHTDPYVYVGLQDITAHVDFTAVAKAAQVAGWQVAGYTNQAAFLLANNLIECAAQLKPDATEQLRLNQAIKLLTLPQEMGELFKVMALTKEYSAPLQGFKLLDFRHKL